MTVNHFMKHSEVLNQVPREFTFLMLSIVIDPCLPPLTYRRPRLRAYFAIPDTSRREAKNRRRNHRSLAIGDVRICKPFTCYPFTFLDNRQASHSVYPFLRRRNVNSAAYNHWCTYVCFRIGWDSRTPFSLERKREGRTRLGDPDPRQIERFLEPRWKVDQRKWASLWKDRSENHTIHHRSILETPALCYALSLSSLFDQLRCSFFSEARYVTLCLKSN